VKVKWRNMIAFDFYYALCLSEKSYYKQCKKLNIENPRPFLNEGANATTHLMRRGLKDLALVCIIVPEGITKIQIYALLVHEAVHIWQEMRDKLKENRPGAEIEAYHIQRIASDFMTDYSDYVKGK